MVFVIKSKYSSVSLFETELNKWYFYCFSAEETLTHYQYTVSFALLTSHFSNYWNKFTGFWNSEPYVYFWMCTVM